MLAEFITLYLSICVIIALFLQEADNVEIRIQVSLLPSFLLSLMLAEFITLYLSICVIIALFLQEADNVEIRIQVSQLLRELTQQVAQKIQAASSESYPTLSMMTDQTTNLCSSTRLNQMRWAWIRNERRKLMEQFRFYRAQWVAHAKREEEVSFLSMILIKVNYTNLVDQARKAAAIRELRETMTPSIIRQVPKTNSPDYKVRSS